MVHVKASKALHHLIGMTVEALVLKKKSMTTQLHNGKKKVVQ